MQPKHKDLNRAGESTIDDKMCQKLIVKFHNASQLSRISEVDSYQIKQ